MIFQSGNMLMFTTEESAQATIVDVAKLAGVAVSTASMALNGNQAIKAATRQKVQQAAETLHYIPNQAARSLLGHKTYSLGALHWPSLNPLHTENSLLLMHLAAERNYNFKIFWNDIHLPETVTPFIQSLRGAIDGLILYRLSNPETRNLLISQLRKIRLPFVFNGIVDDPEVDFVAPDLYRGAQMAMEYLLGIGHRQIATFADSGSPVDHGIEDALKKFDLEFKPVCHVNRTVAYFADAYEIGKKLLSGSPRPTAVFARSDFIALALIRAAWDLGINPGKDLDIVSMDNTEQSAYYMPSLTAVDFNRHRKNQLILNILLQRINNESLPPQQILIEPALVLRESTGQNREIGKC